MTVPVALYVPNLIGYFRILFAFLGLQLAEASPPAAIVIWTISAILDSIDGWIARKLNQQSSLGTLVDIFADNTLRTCTWLAAASLNSSPCRLVAGALIVLEWSTFVCSQLHAAESGIHWKKRQESEDPWIVRQIFGQKNNFLTPLGSLSIYGLFASGLFAFGSQHTIFIDIIPFFYFFMYAAYCGRAIAIIAEIWLCKSYLSLVAQNEDGKRDQTTR
jgi:CDP-diacylglycerol--inositol 3-phosphatidyltransferase